MKGIILAAGLGSRLKERTENIPKALISVNAVPLIDYAINFIYDSVDELIVIGGFCFNKLKSHLETKMLENLTLIENPDYTEGSILTIEKALNHLNDSFLLMNVDHIYPKAFAKRIVTHVKGITGICDFDRSLGEDDMKIKLNKESQIIKIDKKLSDYDGGYIGMTSCHGDDVSQYQKMVQKAIEKGGRGVNVEYVLQLLAEDGILPNTLDLSGSVWLEIDDENDLIHAEEQLKKNPLNLRLDVQ